MSGAVTVTTVAHGVLSIDPKLLPKATPEEVTPLLEAAGLPPGPIRTSINTVAGLPAIRVLIDAGLGSGLAETAGRLPQNFSAAGVVAPESVDVILLTHLHRGHVRGITTNDGNAVFPNAAVDDEPCHFQQRCRALRKLDNLPAG